MWLPHAKEGWICGEIQAIDAGGKNDLVVLPEDGGEVSVQLIRFNYRNIIKRNIYYNRKLKLQKTKLY